jgi:hypothetical protein
LQAKNGRRFSERERAALEIKDAQASAASKRQVTSGVRCVRTATFFPPKFYSTNRRRIKPAGYAGVGQ